nr:hypothetical protein BaRGS_005639 [Batillaria attramentaria]
MSKNDARRVSRSGNGTATSKKLSLEFLFKDINVRIKDKQILHNVSGIANSGEVLAVMGPSVVGDQFTRGLSGGEKKRLSIACELIKDPDIMFLDEPTSGLDSSTAYTLMVLLKQFTEQSGKAVVVTIHQPSSQIFHLFTHLLLLADGHIAYFGDGRKALDFFDELELYCEPHYNPADFILETVKKDKETVQKIIDLAETKRSTALWPAKLRHAATHLKGKHLTNLGSGVGPISSKVHSGSMVLYTDANGDVMVCLDDVEVENNATDVSVTANGSLSTSETSALVQKTEDETPPSSSRWATGFWMQFKMLNWRTYKQSRTRIISKYNIFQSMTIAIIVGLLWFQMERTHDNIKDRLGYLFFMATYWCFMPMFDAIVSFPAERPVFRKEREAGAYRLSALYFAKMSSEMPLILFMPTVFVTITYWMGGLRGVAHFFATWGILLLNVLNCQGIGYVIGSAIWDLQMCITSAAVFVLFGLLSAGYYVNRLPPWLTWARYLSIVCYPYNAMSILELGDLTPISCTNVTSMEMPACLQSNTTVVTPDDILESYGVLLPIYCYVCAIVIQLFFFRTIAYYVMKYKKKPH